MNLQPLLHRVRIERRDDSDPVGGESGVAQQRPPEVAGSDQKRFGAVLPAEEGFNSVDQLLHPEADAGGADHAEHLHVLAGDDRVDVQGAGQRRAGDPQLSLCLQPFEFPQIGGQPFQGR